MKSLTQYIMEGGASGHMAHPYDYTEYTLRDVKGLIRSLFEGRIEGMTEKLDGTNIQATVNPQGEVVFIRNKGDLNSQRGGMTVSDMAAKWADKPGVANTFITAGETIKKVFANIPNKFFNPDKNTKVVANCECIVAGKTNIMPYASTQVDFHNLWVYKFNGTEWIQDDVTKNGLDVINRACEEVDGAQLTPQVLVKTFEDSQRILVDYIKRIDKIFKEAGCREMDTIEEWKYNRFVAYCKAGDERRDFILETEEGSRILFNRWFNGDKSVNIKKIKELYPGHENDIDVIDKKECREWVADVMEPLDTFFADLGNRIIELCDGLLNAGSENEVIAELRDDLREVVADVRGGDNEVLKVKLNKQLERLEKVGNKLNSAEGIVFTYKGKLQKLTGSFAAANQILGSIKFSK